MSIQYRDAIGKWTVVGYSMRPRDALKKIAGELDAIEGSDDLDTVRKHLAAIRERVNLGLAYQRGGVKP